MRWSCVCVGDMQTISVPIRIHPSHQEKVVNLRPTSARCLPGEGGFGFMHFSARIDPPYPMCGVRCNPLNCKLTQDHFVQPLRDQKMPRDRIRGVRE